MLAAGWGAPHVAAMVWDLRGALLKKGEFESARLAEFEFKLRVRSFRLLADRLRQDGDLFAKRTLRETDEELLAALAEACPSRAGELGELFNKVQAEARAALIAELGDPTPNRLL